MTLENTGKCLNILVAWTFYEDSELTLAVHIVIVAAWLNTYTSNLPYWSITSMTFCLTVLLNRSIIQRRWVSSQTDSLQLIVLNLLAASPNYLVWVIVLIALSFAVTSPLDMRWRKPLWPWCRASVVCLQPLSADLWLQVPIMAVNFKGLLGAIPPQPAVVPLDLCVCVCVEEERQSEQLGD